LALELQRVGAHVHGFDIDEDQVRTARAAGIRAEVADGSQLIDILDGRFDAAICRRVLWHESQPAGIVREMARITRPGGRVIAIEPDLVALEASRFTDADDAALAAAVMAQLCEAVDDTTGIDFRIGSRLPTLFADAGLLDATLAEHADGPPPGLAPDGLERDMHRGCGGDADAWDRWAALPDRGGPPRRGMFTCVAIVRSLSSRT